MGAIYKRKIGVVFLVGMVFGSIITTGLRLWGAQQVEQDMRAAAQQGFPLPDGPALKPLHSVVVRVDSVEFMQDVGDDDGVGELSLHTLAIRRQGRSGKLSYPTDGNPLVVYPHQIVPLNKFSLQIEAIEAGEIVEIYFLALDEDKMQSIEQSIATDLALNIAVESMGQLLSAGAKLPYANLATFFADFYFGNLADWWETADFIGIYRLRIDPDNFERIDRAYDEISFDGNMRIKFAILSGYTSQEVPVTREVMVTREVDVTREVPVTRNVEVTREVPVIREVVVGPVTEVTRIVPAVQPVVCPAPSGQTLICTAISIIQPVQPVAGEYPNPVTFRWNGSLSNAYKVYLVHPESGARHESEWIQDIRWTFDIPKEQFGHWQWFVVDDLGRRSDNIHFVFNPHPKPGGQ